MLSSLLAESLAIASPEPALIELESSLAEILPSADDRVAEGIRKSVGVNFGTRLLTGGYRIWPVDMAIPMNLRQAAVEVFAFDALIENPDRRYDNPNILWRDEQMFVIDHESAFSFIYAIGGHSEPWNLEDAVFLRNHVFYRALKGGKVETDRFAGALAALSDEAITGVENSALPEWKNEHLTRILQHLRSVRDHTAEFAEQVKRRLA
ncbi:MAG: HipA family kinase [Terriglobia bacterium]